MPKHEGGSVTVLLRAPRPVKTISLDFVQFSFKLLSSDQDLTYQLARTGVRVICWNDDVGVVGKFD